MLSKQEDPEVCENLTSRNHDAENVGQDNFDEQLLGCQSEEFMAPWAKLNNTGIKVFGVTSIVLLSILLLTATYTLRDTATKAPSQEHEAASKSQNSAHMVELSLATWGANKVTEGVTKGKDSASRGVFGALSDVKKATNVLCGMANGNASFCDRMEGLASAGSVLAFGGTFFPPPASACALGVSGVLSLVTGFATKDCPKPPTELAKMRRDMDEQFMKLSQKIDDLAKNITKSFHRVTKSFHGVQIALLHNFLAPYERTIDSVDLHFRRLAHEAAAQNMNVTQIAKQPLEEATLFEMQSFLNGNSVMKVVGRMSDREVPLDMPRIMQTIEDMYISRKFLLALETYSRTARGESLSFTMKEMQSDEDVYMDLFTKSCVAADRIKTIRDVAYGCYILNEDGSTKVHPRVISDITGSIEDMPGDLTSLSMFRGARKISGTYSMLPRGAEIIQLPRANLVSGSLEDLPRFATTISLANAQGLLSNLPPTVTKLTIKGEVVGSFMDLPRSLTELDITVKAPHGSLTGSFAELPPHLSLLRIEASGLGLTGRIVDLPRNLTALRLYLLHGITGDLKDLPPQLEELDLHPGEEWTVSGNMEDLPLNLSGRISIGRYINLHGSPFDCPCAKPDGQTDEVYVGDDDVWEWDRDDSQWTNYGIGRRRVQQEPPSRRRRWWW